MTSKRSLRIKTHTLSAFVLFLTGLTVLIAFAAPARQAGTAQPSAKSSAASVLMQARPTQGLLPALPRVVRAVSRLQEKRHAATMMTPDNSLSFLPAVTYDSGGAFPASVAVADLNVDGKPDLVVVNDFSSSVGVLLGNGDGTFQPAASYDSGGLFAQWVAVADVNGDGKPDILVADQCVNSGDCSGSVGVLLGNGDGTFQSAVSYGSGAYSPNSVAVADVDGDGKPDLLVANLCLSSFQCDGVGAVGVLLGNGDGTFRPAVTYDTGGDNSTSVVAADVNGDGRLDLLVLNACALSGGGYCVTIGTAGVLLGNGDGTFQSALTYATGGGGVGSLAVADVDGDGRPDLVVASCCGSAALGLLLGNGDGTLQPALVFGSGGLEPESVAIADVNGDGKTDVITANFFSNTVAVLLNSTVASPTTTTLASSLNPSAYGQPITFTATVTTSGPTAPTGTVNFKWGPDGIGQGTLNASGVATFTTSILKPGPYKITAVYKGDASNLTSTSAVLHQGVKAK